MTFAELVTLAYEHLGDAAHSIAQGRVESAINHSHRNLVLLGARFDPSLVTRSKLFSWTHGISNTGWATELEIPAEFHRAIALTYALSANLGTPFPVLLTGEIIHVREWAVIAGRNTAHGDRTPIAFIRHSKPGKDVVSSVKRVDERVAAITVTVNPYVLGVHRLNGPNAGVQIAWRLLYIRNPDDMSDVDDVPRLPEEHHEAIAAGAALRLAAMQGNPAVKTLAAIFSAKVSLMKETMRMRRGEMVA